MTIEKTEDISSGDNIVMAVYGGAKSGKTSFAASTAKCGKTLLIDFEKGTEYLGERGINCDVIRMGDWFSQREVDDLKKAIPDYDFIIIDPVGEAMDFLITGSQVRGAKNRQSDGSLTQSGWGEVKLRMRGFLKYLKTTGKTIILVFHDDRYKFENELYHSLMIATKLKEVIPGMVEIVTYLGVSKDPDGKPERVLYTPAQGGNFDSGDRTGRVPERVPVSEFDGWHDFISSLKPKLVLEEVDKEDADKENPGEEDVIDV
ncbi:MAG: AAA family ATPase [Methanosarcinales archaeon]|nr:AAA family ATPase [Methanosarcinales archaeon]